MKLLDIHRYIHYIHRQVNTAMQNIILHFSLAVKEPSSLSPPVRWQKKKRAREVINCSLTRLIDRNKLRSIYIFLKMAISRGRRLYYERRYPQLDVQKALCRVLERNDSVISGEVEKSRPEYLEKRVHRIALHLLLCKIFIYNTIEYNTDFRSI